jgi:hypothetical protein
MFIPKPGGNGHRSSIQNNYTIRRYMTLLGEGDELSEQVAFKD